MTPESLPQPGPVSEAITNNIRVEVLARHSPDSYRTGEGQWLFEYTVRITNEGLETVQLVSRHWYITDALDNVREVEGAGVVGKQPVLGPGESFKYSSWCPLKTPTGVMRGTYTMVRSSGEQFLAEIAPFALRARYAVQ
jgi:ApaG protein